MRRHFKLDIKHSRPAFFDLKDSTAFLLEGSVSVHFTKPLKQGATDRYCTGSLILP